MSSDLLGYIAASIQKSSEQLIAAAEKLPDDKIYWSVEGKARSAANQAAECALMGGDIANLLKTRKWPEDYSFEEFGSKLLALAENWTNVKVLLQENTEKLANSVLNLPPDELTNQVQMPWGPMTVLEIASYPTWNMSYHEGQINFIANLV